METIPFKVEENRKGRLFAAICDLRNLRLAWREVEAKGSRGGIDRVGIEEFARKAEKNLERLSWELKEKRYVPEPAERFYFRKASGGHRPLGMPTVRDKVVQKTLVRSLEPLVNRRFLDCSYAYRPNKGHRKAIHRVEHYLGQGLTWVTSCDIDSFFDTLDHPTLMKQVRKHVWEPEVLALIQLFLKIGVVGSGGYQGTETGIGQGNVLSPLLSNIYLNPFDHALKRRGFIHVRFADDYVILCESKDKAEEAFRYAEGYLRDVLKLRLNPVSRTARPLDEGFTFLGVLFRGGDRTMAPEKLEKAKWKIQGWERRKGWTLPALVSEANESVRSWRFHYGELRVEEQFRELDGLIAEVVGKIAGRLVAEGSLTQQDARGVLAGLMKLRPDATRQVVPKKSPVAAKPKAREPQAAQRPGDEPKRPERSVLAAVSRKRVKYQKLHLMQEEILLSQPGTFLGKRSQRLVLKQGGRTLKEFPALRLKNVLVSGRGITLSSDALSLCSRFDIQVSFVDFTGRPVARLVKPVMESTECSLAQLRVLDSGRWLRLAKCFVRGKIRNQWNLIKQLNKYHGKENPDFQRLFETESGRVEEYLQELGAIRFDAANPEKTRGQLFAVEGRSASAYWSLFRTVLDPELGFQGRRRRGAEDLFNSLLNYGYGILYNRIWGAILLAGLSPSIGFLHVSSSKRPALVFDLIEEFRAQAVDRAALTLANRNEPLDLSGRLLSARTRNRMARAVLDRLHSPTRYRSRSAPLGKIIRMQALALARALKDNKRYRPFVAKW